MGLFNKLKDNFKSSDFSVAGNSKVKTLKKNFEKSFNGAVLRVYYGTTFSNEDYSIAKIRNKENPGSGQEFKAKASWTVKRLEDASNINLRAEGFPAELIDGEPETKGAEI